jgi:hypothetical protein
MDSRESLVELIFSKCALVYGRDFLSRWEGQNLTEVLADWSRELGRVLDNPRAIRYGLEHLPNERPPTVLQFRSICVGRPDESPKQLRGPASDSSVVNEAVARALANVRKNEGPRAWANRLRIREQKADRLTPAQRTMWLEALKTDDVSAKPGHHSIVDPECLPPGMKSAA